MQTVADKKSALRFTGDAPIVLEDVEATWGVEDGFTIEAWVRPSAVERGVVLYPEEKLGGSGVAFGPGRYDDLYRFRVTKEFDVNSLRVPPGHVAVLFSETGCHGLAHIAQNDAISLADDWARDAHSLLVVDLNHTAQSYAIAYKEPERTGDAAVLNMRRYDALTFLPPGQTSFASIETLAGVEVTLYNRPRCEGASFSVENGQTVNIDEASAQVDDWKGSVQSLAVTRATNGTQPAASASAESQRAAIFAAESDTGLWLDIVPSSSPVRPPEIRFAGASLRADRWHHIALTYDGTNLVSYLNGRAVNTRVPDDTPDLSGDWRMGDGFYGDIGVVSLFAGARSPKKLRASRFDLPRADQTNEDPDDGAILLAAWLLEPESADSESIIEIVNETSMALPGGEAFWVVAQLPRSLLTSAIGRKALSQAKQRANDAEQQARVKGQATVDKARNKAQQQVRDANARAQSQAHAARIERIHAICGGVLTHFGPSGKKLGTAANDYCLWLDTAYDPGTGFVYLAGWYMENTAEYSLHRLQSTDVSGAPELITWRNKPIYALTVDSEQEHLYWIEGRDLLGGSTTLNTTSNVLVPNLLPGRPGEWHLTFDPRHRKLLWSNGREIWSGVITDDNQAQNGRVVVSHGASPHPTALTVDDETGDIYWLDKELEMVRTSAADGSNIRNLYEALDPRAGIALDYMDLSQLTGELSTHPAVTRKRLYWNAEYRVQTEAAIIDDPGLFCWLQHVEDPVKPQNNIAAMEDTHFIGAKWTEWLDEPGVLYEDYDHRHHIYQFFASPEHQLHALKHYDSPQDEMMWWIQLWTMGERDEGTLDEHNMILLWLRGGSTSFENANPPPSLYAANRTGTRFICDRILNDDSTSRTGAMIFEPHPSNNRFPIERDGITALAFSEDGEQALIGLDFGEILVWSANTPVEMYMGCDENTSETTSDEDQSDLDKPNSAIQCIATYAVAGAAGDRQIALYGSQAGAVMQLDLETSECLRKFKGHDQSVNAIAVSRDRKIAVSASVDTTLKVWDLVSGACLQTLSGHGKAVNDVAIHPDSNRVISASDDQAVKLWDAQRGVCLHTFAGHDSPVHKVAVSGDGQQFISVGEDKTLQWDMRRAWKLTFDGEHNYIDLGPLHLDCDHGFSIELQLWLADIPGVMEFVSLGNGRDGDNITLTLSEDGVLTFGVNQHGASTEIATEGDALSIGQWHTVSVSVDATGAGVIQIDGEEAGSGQVTLPRTCLRMQNEVGRSSADQNAYLHGEIGMLRLWNRALTVDEIDAFHKQPLALPTAPQPTYHRSMMEYRNGRPYLMSGMSDGSTPADALFEMALDKGLVIESKSTDAHAKLLIAQHNKEVADRQAAADRAAAQQTADDKTRAAHASNQADHAHAQQMLSVAHTDAANKRADAHEHLAATSQNAQQQVATAHADARRQKSDAEQHAEQIKGNAYSKADQIKRKANQDLSAAQAEKAQYE